MGNLDRSRDDVVSRRVICTHFLASGKFSSSDKMIQTNKKNTQPHTHAHVHCPATTSLQKSRVRHERCVYRTVSHARLALSNRTEQGINVDLTGCGPRSKHPHPFTKPHYRASETTSTHRHLAALFPAHSVPGAPSEKKALPLATWQSASTRASSHVRERDATAAVCSVQSAWTISLTCTSHTRMHIALLSTPPRVEVAATMGAGVYV